MFTLVTFKRALAILDLHNTDWPRDYWPSFDLRTKGLRSSVIHILQNASQWNDLNMISRQIFTRIYTARNPDAIQGKLMSLEL